MARRSLVCSLQSGCLNLAFLAVLSVGGGSCGGKSSDDPAPSPSGGSAGARAAAGAAGAIGGRGSAIGGSSGGEIGGFGGASAGEAGGSVSSYDTGSLARGGAAGGTTLSSTRMAGGTTGGSVAPSASGAGGSASSSGTGGVARGGTAGSMPKSGEGGGDPMLAGGTSGSMGGNATGGISTAGGGTSLVAFGGAAGLSGGFNRGGMSSRGGATSEAGAAGFAGGGVSCPAPLVEKTVVIPVPAASTPSDMAAVCSWTGSFSTSAPAVIIELAFDSAEPTHAVGLAKLAAGLKQPDIYMAIGPVVLEPVAGVQISGGGRVADGYAFDLDWTNTSTLTLGMSLTFQTTLSFTCEPMMSSTREWKGKTQVTLCGDTQDRYWATSNSTCTGCFPP